MQINNEKSTQKYAESFASTVPLFFQSFFPRCRLTGQPKDARNIVVYNVSLRLAALSRKKEKNKWKLNIPKCAIFWGAESIAKK